MKKYFLSLLILPFLIIPPPAEAASQDECKIWLCLPSGFPSGCSSAYSAMLRRIRHFQPPLPSFMSCAVSSGSQNAGGASMSFDSDYAAYIPSRQVCTGSPRYNNRQCHQTSPTYIRGTKCISTVRFKIPVGCTKTVVYVDIFSEGQAINDTTYVDF